MTAVQSRSGTSTHSDVPILVVSCDRYADLWNPFFTIFFRQWPDCPHPIFLGSNFARYEDPRVQMLNIGEDLSWGSGVASMVDKLGSEHVMLLLEDFLIEQPVDGARIRTLVEIAQSEPAACIRLSPLPAPSLLPSRRVPAHPELGVVEPGTPYRVSAQPAVWRVEALKQYLVPGFSAWQFEEIGSRLSDYRNDIFWGPFRPAIVYDHGVEKGRWRQIGVEICRRLDVPLDLQARAVLSDGDLRELYRPSDELAPLYSLKRRMVDAFSTGDRRRGVTLASEILRQRLWPDVVIIALAGIVGGWTVRLLDRLQLELKVRRSRREFQRRKSGPAPA